MKLVSALIPLIALLLGTGAFAGEGLEIKEALKRGLEFSPEVKKAEAGVREAEASTAQKESALLPTVDANATAVAKKDATSLNALGSAVNLSAHNEDYNANLKLSQPLYAGGAITNALASYKLAENIARQKLFSARQGAVNGLVTAYFNLAKAEKSLKAAEEHRTVLKAYADITANYEKIGRSRRTDRLVAVVNLALTEADIDRLRKEHAVASDALKRLIGLSEGGEPLETKSQVVIAPVAPVPLVQALDAATANNPDLKQVEMQAKKQTYDNEVDLATDFPTLSLDGLWGYRAPDRPTWFDEPSRFYSVGLTLKIPLFSGLSSLGKRRVHAARTYSVERDLQIKRLDVRQKLQAAINTVAAEYNRLNTAQTAVGQGREALNLANQGYRQGISSSQDVLNAQTTRYRSETLLIDTQFAYLLALLDLRSLMGVDLEKAYAN